MTEAFIREIAARFGLDVLKRITTGSEQNGFATFELSGSADAIGQAWEHFKPHVAKGFGGLTHVSNADHPDRGKPYIELQSVYFAEGYR